MLPCSRSYCLATVSQLTHCSNCPVCNISTRTTQKTPFLSCFLLLPCKDACLRSRYSVTAFVFSAYFAVVAQQHGIFWDVTSYSLVEVYPHLRSTYRHFERTYFGSGTVLRNVGYLLPNTRRPKTYYYAWSPPFEPQNYTQILSKIRFIYSIHCKKILTTQF
jgi:hypothetical protein